VIGTTMVCVPMHVPHLSLEAKGTCRHQKKVQQQPIRICRSKLLVGGSESSCSSSAVAGSSLTLEGLKVEVDSNSERSIGTPTNPFE
jgi:hypothetical protein